MTRVPRIHDVVEVTDREGKLHRAMVIGLTPDGEGQPRITPRFLGARGPGGIFNAVRYDASGAPLTWRFPA